MSHSHSQYLDELQTLVPLGSSSATPSALHRNTTHVVETGGSPISVEVRPSKNTTNTLAFFDDKNRDIGINDMTGAVG